jgi:hypothetical protein
MYCGRAADVAVVVQITLDCDIDAKQIDEDDSGSGVPQSTCARPYTSSVTMTEVGAPFF